MLFIKISYIFLYVWNLMKLYDKKFRNCMIKSFGQPGWRRGLEKLSGSSYKSAVGSFKEKTAGST